MVEYEYDVLVVVGGTKEQAETIQRLIVEVTPWGKHWKCNSGGKIAFFGWNIGGEKLPIAMCPR